MVNIIVAVGNYVQGVGFPMGKGGSMPWHNKADLKWFKDMTTGHPVIMGRKTYESIGHPLKNRVNIVVTTRDDLWAENAGIRIYRNLESAVDFARSLDEEVFIIGGASIYDYALEHDLVDRIYIDMLSEEVKDADTFFPDVMIHNDWEEVGTPIEIENRKAYAMQYVKIRGKENHVDDQYLALIDRIIKEGVEKDTRAGKTRSIFGVQMRFNLKEGLPMLTTKKMFAKGVIHELLWFLKGDTNIKYLVDNGVHIWDDDAYRYFLSEFKYGSDDFRFYKDKKFLERGEDGQLLRGENGAFIAKQNPNLTKEEFIELVKKGEKWSYAGEHFPVIQSYTFGDLGPVYGKQWRRWGNVDQIEEVIEKLRSNPDDRRIMISAWNVGEIKDMALPPCHYSCQFWTKKLENGKRELSCLWNQRSVDVGCGLPFNIMSYALLTNIIAQCCDMEVGELIFNGGDVHIYENHIEKLKEQCERNPNMYALPKLLIKSKEIGMSDSGPSYEIKRNIDEFVYSDFVIDGYKSYPPIKLELNVGL